jgi:hypothetical protein
MTQIEDERAWPRISTGSERKSGNEEIQARVMEKLASSQNSQVQQETSVATNGSTGTWEWCSKQKLVPVLKRQHTNQIRT